MPNRVFAVLAEAEGAVHGIDAADVELHEVGALDAIVDVVGVAAALHSLGIDQIVASPIAMGHGTVRAAHGDLPNPPPAVARLLAQRQVPVVGVETTMELATPTGVAVLVALADRFGALPAMTVEAVGYGAGTADPPGRPNVVQVLVGTATAPSRTPRPGRTAVQLEVNVDDVTGEVLAHTIAALVAAGAHDAWATPIVMKKGRPAHTVAALVDPADVERLAAVLLAETGSLGVRADDRRALAAAARGGRRRRRRPPDPRQARPPAGPNPNTTTPPSAATALGLPLRDVLRVAETLAAGTGRAAVGSVLRDRPDRRRSRRTERGHSGGVDPGQSSRVAAPGRHRAAAGRQLLRRRRRPGRARRAPTASASRR